MFTPQSFTGKLFKAYLRSFKHPSKIRVQNAIGRSLFSKGINFKNSQGCTYRLDANDWISRIFLLEGDYENGSTALAKNMMKNGGLFVDIGANFGLFTCQVAVQNPAIKVIAVEPNYKIIGRLLSNIALNKLEQQVQVLNMAVSGKTQFVSMEQCASDNLGTVRTIEGTAGGLAILSSSLQFILQEQGEKEVMLLKVDIEGNEFELLRYFPFNEYRILNIILEFNHLSAVPLHELIDFFKAQGYMALDIYGAVLSFGIQEIPENNIWFKKANF